MPVCINVFCVCVARSCLYHTMHKRKHIHIYKIKVYNDILNAFSTRFSDHYANRKEFTFYIISSSVKLSQYINIISIFSWSYLRLENSM